MKDGRPSTATILAHLVPRLKELRAAGCRVFVETDNLPQEVLLDKTDRPYAQWIEGGPAYLTQSFFDKIFDEDYGAGNDYTIEDVMQILWVEITVANYKEKITALTKKE